MEPYYDLIIVGSGVAGLRVGIESLKRKPNIRCCILEKYGYVGGRVVTFRKDVPKIGGVQWENGAGRISILHKKVLSLFKQYGLTFIPLDDEVDFIEEPTRSDSYPHIESNKFTDLIKVYLEPLLSLSKENLATHTIKELLDGTQGSGAAKHFYEQFPYYSEIHTLRADVALESFQKEMGTYNGFGVCREGLSALTDSMMAEFIRLGGTIHMDAELCRISSNADKSIDLHCKIRGTDRFVSYTGKTVVLALHHNALRNIDGVSNLSVLKKLTMMPLVRIYAVFPSRGGISWFSGLKKIATNSPIRYIIPMDSRRGIIMISYTDGADAKVWMKLEESGGEENVKDLVMTEIRKLFPDRTIPDPIFFKQHSWGDGCTYWLPGEYDVKVESKKSLQPLPNTMPNLFMCGESFAVHQCWIESALKQADKLLACPKFSI
jgi:monoamine oxidase